MSTLVVPPVLTSPRDDAMQLYRAFKGFGCDSSAVINILAHRDVSQRALIQQEYRTMYSEDLNKRLSSELSGDVKKAVLLWMHDPAGRDASLVRQALGGSSIDLKAATEVICSRTPSQLQHLRQLYHATYGVYIEHDIEFQASGDHKKMGKIGEKLDIDFVVSAGDNFYDDGLKGVNDPAFLESFKNIYTAKSLQKPWYSVLGNHDYRGDVEAQLRPILRKIDGRWLCMRSFIVDADIAEFFFVDTTPFVDNYFLDPKDHTYDWRGISLRGAYLVKLLEDLASALNESTAPWKIVVGHHGIRSIGHHGDTLELVMQLLPLLEAHNVDFYMNGHDHCLEHTRCVDSKIHFLTSGAGSKAWMTDELKSHKQCKVDFFHRGQGFLSMELTSTEAKFAFYDVFGQVGHRCTVAKHLHSSV